MEKINKRLTELYSDVRQEVGDSTMDFIDEIVRLEIDLFIIKTK